MDVESCSLMDVDVAQNESLTAAVNGVTDTSSNTLFPLQIHWKNSK
jgi:hypothetical protein